MTKNIVTVEKTDRIAMVRFDRGDNANSLSFAIMQELTEVANDLAEAPDLCNVVLTGRVDNFSLGSDLKYEAVPDGKTVENALVIARRAASLPPNGVRLCKMAINAYANTPKEKVQTV